MDYATEHFSLKDKYVSTIDQPSEETKATVSIRVVTNLRKLNISKTTKLLIVSILWYPRLRKLYKPINSKLVHQRMNEYKHWSFLLYVDIVKSGVKDYCFNFKRYRLR